MRGAPVFLRDLSEEMQKEHLREWAEAGKTALIKASKTDTDIIVGYYLENAEVEK